ncbi:site-specific integrase [Ruminococcaceae bacterium OttesenSCG-928-I18]|nr:site-specific integrase [Ruminococcaceae bacterium OttesenSCG-928-I18]
MMAKRNASGAGTISQRSDGRWEGRVTLGRDPGTGKQLRRSVYADSQGEVVKLIQKLQTEREAGTYTEPAKMTVSAWLDIWQKEYLGGVKQSTQASYAGHIKNHIRPALGAVNLQKLNPHQIQGFYNNLMIGDNAISSKTVRNIHGIVHSMLDQAQKNGYIKSNPSEVCTLPRWVKKEMQVMDDDVTAAFLTAIVNDPYECIYFIDLFTGMRQSETLGLTWDAVDFTAGTITISKQLLRERKAGGKYYLDTTKNDKAREIMPAPSLCRNLKNKKTAKQNGGLGLVRYGITRWT